MYKAFSVPRDAFVYVIVLTAVTAAVVVQRILLTVVFVTATHRAHTNILFDRSVPRMEQLSKPNLLRHNHDSIVIMTQEIWF